MRWLGLVWAAAAIAVAASIGLAIDAVMAGFAALRESTCGRLALQVMVVSER
jgi:uncharacterized membrane protein